MTNTTKIFLHFAFNYLIKNRGGISHAASQQQKTELLSVKKIPAVAVIGI